MDDTSDLSQSLQRLNEHFQKLVSLMPTQDFFQKSNVTGYLPDEEEPIPEKVTNKSPAVQKLSKKEKIIKHNVMRRDGLKQVEKTKPLKKERLVSPRKKEKKKQLGRVEVVEMIKKQKGDDSGVDTNGSVDSDEVKSVDETEDATDVKDGKMEISHVEEEENQTNESKEKRSVTGKAPKSKSPSSAKFKSTIVDTNQDFLSDFHIDDKDISDKVSSLQIPANLTSLPGGKDKVSPGFKDTNDGKESRGSPVKLKDSRKANKKRRKAGRNDDSDDEKMVLKWSSEDKPVKDHQGEDHNLVTEISDKPHLSELREKVRSKILSMESERKGTKQDDKSSAGNQKLKQKLKQLRKEKKKAAVATKKKMKQDAGTESKEDDKVTEEEEEVVHDPINPIKYSKFNFEAEPSRSRSKKTKNMIERQTGRNFKLLLDKAERKKEKYENLKEQDPDMAVDWLSQEKWRKAVLKAEGVKIKDDVDLLKKSLKRTEKRKQKSRRKVEAMEEKVISDKKERQLKRYRNLQERKHQKKAKKVKRLQKKGKLLLPDRDKM